MSIGLSIRWRMMWVMAGLLFALPAVALQTFQVNSTADQPDDDISDGICHTAAGTCTLRAAVMQANTFAAQGATILVPAGTYTLQRPVLGSDGDSEGDLNLTGTRNGNVTTSIIGAGASATIIDGNQIDRVFSIDPSLIVVISNMTLRGGLASDFGGCISNHGQLTLEYVVITQCSSVETGGAIASSNYLVIVKSTITNNTTSGVGGGLSNTGDAEITQSALVGNVAPSGGAIYSGGPTTLTNSTIAGNAADFGGAIWQDHGGSTSLYNTTVVYNVSPRFDAQDYGTAGIYMTSGPPVLLSNSIVAGNMDQNARAESDCDASLKTQAVNLLGAASVCDQEGCSPTGIEGCPITQQSGHYTQLNSTGYLGLITQNGGYTATVALLSGSNAIDGGTLGCVDAKGNSLKSDQREYPRPVGAACDIGAFEHSDAVFVGAFE